MSQIALVISTFEQYPLLFLALVLICVMVAGAMYRVLLQPKLKGIADTANANSVRITDIKQEMTKTHESLKDDLNVKHYELKSDIKDLVHSMSEATDKLLKGLMGGVTEQITHMNQSNESQHSEMFAKVDELAKGFHSNEKRITILEQK